ncbi:MAG: phosphohistidine phosphatase [Thiotrichales bacterium]|nr:MAG: phosphohistidine phosphatase [Thiotrichales bacterium]
MTKKLLLVRHAKSGWEDFSQPDHNRPLDKRGLADAPMMGQRLLRKQIVPDLIVSSTAYRAEATAKIIATELKLLDKVTTNSNIYEAGIGNLMDVILGLEDQFDQVMLVGHNPGLTLLVNYLQDDKYISNMQTCATALLSFEVESWADVEAGKLLDYDYPKNQQR